MNRLLQKPPFLLHWRYLSPNKKNRAAQHRQVFLQCWQRQPRHLHFPLLLWQCVYWYGFSAWYLSLRVSFRRNFTIKKNHDLSRLQCLGHLLYFSLGFCLTPHDALRYKLYKDKKKVFDYWYGFEGSALHEINNRLFIGAKKAQYLLADKFAFAEALRLINIPHIPTQELKDKSLSSILNGKNNYFIKPNIANCAKGAGALVFDHQHNTHTWHPINGLTITEPTTVKNYLTRLAKSKKTIIQPLLNNHPDLIEQFNSENLITFRLITHKSPNRKSIPIYCQIEVALATKGKKQKQFYHIAIVDLITFELHHRPESNKKSEPLPSLNNTLITHIKQAIQYCSTAHDQLFDCYSIGFDLCITPDGPVIIEGNYGWNVSLVSSAAPTPNRLQTAGVK